MEQRSIIDFSIVSTDLFSSVVEVKKGTELSTDYQLLVCMLKDLNYLRTRKEFRAGRAHRVKWELFVKKKMRDTFASKVASLFKEFPDFVEDIETAWDLFKSAMITPAAAK